MMGHAKKLGSSKSDKKLSAQDPKSAALAHLGIAIGSKNMRNLCKEDIDEAFIKKMHDSEHNPENYVHPPRVPSKRAFQRSLHESYQYMMKSMIDAANLEANRRKKLMAIANPTSPAPPEESSSTDPESLVASDYQSTEQ